MAWAKLHTDILGDPKLLRAARKGLKGLEYLPWLIAFAKGADDDGRLTVGGEPAEVADIADLVPGATRKNISDCLKSLEKIGVLLRENGRENDENSSKSVCFLRFSSWKRRSGTKPSDKSDAILERVHRHRTRRKIAEDTASQSLPIPTAHEDSEIRNALHHERCNATEKEVEKEKETERETETEKKHIPASPVFVMAWTIYPPRAGSNPRRLAERAWSARVREGVHEAEMFAGTERYRAYAEATDILGSSYVMQAQRFYGPNREYEGAWTFPSAPKDGLEARVAAAQREADEQGARDDAWLALRRSGAPSGVRS